MNKGIIYLGALALLFTSSCSADKTQGVQAESARAESVINNAAHATHMLPAQTDGQAPSAGAPALAKDSLPKDLVCMVNNAYMGKKQYPVQFGEKLYYGCCEMCVKTIQNERQVRVALDPQTGKEVDKSLAFIALKPGSVSGEVLYFESESSYREYVKNSQVN